MLKRRRTYDICESSKEQKSRSKGETVRRDEPLVASDLNFCSTYCISIGEEGRERVNALRSLPMCCMAMMTAWTFMI